MAAVIYGTGAMKDYAPGDAAPWHVVRSCVNMLDLIILRQYLAERDVILGPQ